MTLRPRSAAHLVCVVLFLWAAHGIAAASSTTACPPSITNCEACMVSYGMSLCSNCSAGYTVAVDDERYDTLGRCHPYSAADAATCTVPNCHRCAYKNSSQCGDCLTGVYTSEYLCPDYVATTTTTTTTASPTTSTTSTTPTPATPSPTAGTAAPTTSTTTSTTSTSTPTTPTPTTSTTTTTTTTTTKSPCAVANCDTCNDASPSVCSKCVLGYTIMRDNACRLSGSCVVANCLQCNAADDTSCATCVLGYKVGEDGQCRRSGSNVSGGPWKGSRVVVTVLVAAAAVGMAL